MSDYIIGLTGGVAAGKSALGERMAAHGVVLVDADIAAREVVAVGSQGLDEVVAAFGNEVLDADGTLDREAMRGHVFHDDHARKQLEAIIHPRVHRHLQAACKAATGPYAVAAIPLLSESGGPAAYPWLDRVIVVDVPRDVQIARLQARDGIDRALAQRILDAQATRQERLAIADDVVVNTGPLTQLDDAASALDARYRLLAGVAS